MNEESNPWKTLSKEVKYDNNWIQVSEHQVINPAGGNGIYGVVHFRNYAIGIVPMDNENNIYLVGQYRYPLNKYSWEIPEGGGALDIDPLQSAKRELLEETGLVAKHWQEVMRLHLSNSVTDELAILYLAKNLEQFDPEPEETEELKIKKIHFDEALEMVINGEITDAMSVAAIMRIRLMNLNNNL
jgi:ADP-ribose pyrophosphatase